MKSTKLTLITIVFLIGLTVPLESAAQQPRYTVFDLGTLGGSFSIAFGVNNRGAVSGFSDVPGDVAQHAFIWRRGKMTDLGTFGGPNSIARDRLNALDQIGGRAETSVPDPLGEDFCFFGNNLVCLPFVWTKGVLIPLPTLGGNNGVAHGVNNRGQVVGLAENTTPDPTCTPPQLLQFKPVFWQKGQVQELPTFPGDPDGFVDAINDRGQAAGASGDCTATTRHALVWQNGTTIDLGNLGGSGIVPQAINNQGQIVGQAALPGDVTSHAFLWQNGVITDLGTLPGDDFSAAFGINSKGQVVGLSCGAAGCAPVVWHNGTITDLNTLLPVDSALLILAPRAINARGEIVGAAVNTNSGEVHACLAIPQPLSAKNIEAPARQTSTRPIVVNEVARRMLSRYANDNPVR